ncbi:MAG TPA: RNA polymerase sigma factor [Steroidobacteraceae bacterium]|jgi:RNA polymerase sigma-70 factor (ECF subfamily)
MDNYTAGNTASSNRWARVAQLRGDVHADLLRYLVTRMPGQDADDVAQECYLRIHRCEHLLTLENPKAFLFRIATNLLTDRARQRVRHTRSQQLMGIAPGMDDDFAEAATSQPALEDSIVAAEELQRVADAIDVLPPKCRQAFLMQRLEGSSHEHIARALNVSKSMVEKYIAKALYALHAALD